MGKKRLIRWMILVPLVVASLILIIVLQEPEKNAMNRAEAARAMTLAIVSPEELETWKKEYGASHFSAERLDAWYVPYFDYLYEHGYWTEEVTPATAEGAQGALTYAEVAHFARQLSPSLETLLPTARKHTDRAFPETDFWLFYDSVLQAVETEDGVAVEELYIYGTPENIPEAAAWTVYTNRGAMKFHGLALDRYLDHEIRAYVRGNAVIYVLEDRGSEVTYKNVWLIDGDEESVTVFVGDVKRQILFAKKSKKTDSILQHLADVQLKDGKIIKVSLKKETITGKVLSVQEDAIEIEGYGSILLDEEYKVLRTYGELKRQKLSDILVGYAREEFVVAKGKICAVLTVRDFHAEKIRVLLMDEGFQSKFHERVTVSWEGELTVRQGDDVWKIEAGQPYTYTHGDRIFQKGRVIIETDDKQEIRLDSLTRAQGIPSYSGRLELLDTEEGLVLINELYLEDYLKKVVPSEMPSSYEKEALKAQAVCARTYAYMQIQGNTYSEYGAHVDDSIDFQVYNNHEADEKTTKAVQETYGKLLLYDGNPVSAFYFSTSCGTTTDAAIWGSDPADTPYLKSIAVQPGKTTLELDENEAFLAFIKDFDYPSYDSSYPMYRWNVLTNSEWLTEQISGVGLVENIRITKRGAGGVAQELTVTGKDGEKVIRGQNAIRAALGSDRLTLYRKDGSTSTGWSSLPSGFLAIEDVGTDAAGRKQFRIYGGGYGHGVGMSQNGAQSMARAGFDYRDILEFFYDGITIGEAE